MGQVGLHGLTGLVAGRYLLDGGSTDLNAQRTLLFGFTIGNLAPDLDVLAVAAVYPIDKNLALQLHRGFTHSLLAVITTAVGCYVISLLMHQDHIRHFGSGLALGFLTHIVEDIFVWFASVDIFWPCSLYGIIPPVDIWQWFVEPPWLERQLGTAEFAAMALYFRYITDLAVMQKTNLDMVEPVRRITSASWAVWAVVTLLALVLPDAAFAVSFYLLQGIVFAPVCYYVTWRMQATIEGLAVTLPPPELPPP